MLSKKILNISLICGLLCSIFLSLANFNVSCDGLRSNLLRLHIIANSDSEQDQQLKLEIRDAILENSYELFEKALNTNEAIHEAECAIPRLEEIANNVIKENGFSYKAVATVGDSYFETREYENFTLPAGTYKSLIITVGEGKGKNWWCVLFPTICLPSAGENSIASVAGEDCAQIAENPQKFIMRFKAVEIYEDIKKHLKER